MARDQMALFNYAPPRRGLMSPVAAPQPEPPRPTEVNSAESLRELKPVLGRRQKIVYDALRAAGQLTGKQLDMTVATKGDSSPHKRLSELEKLGLVRVVATVICEYTGRKVASWNVT